MGNTAGGGSHLETMSAKTHRADRDRVRPAFNATLAIVSPYKIDFKILIENKVQWVSARGLGSDDGLYQGYTCGAFFDVTGRKQAEEGHERLAWEMSRRVKNLLSIATGLTILMFKSTVERAKALIDVCLIAPTAVERAFYLASSVGRHKLDDGGDRASPSAARLFY